jgi:hypothetical protein
MTDIRIDGGLTMKKIKPANTHHKSVLMDSTKKGLLFGISGVIVLIILVLIIIENQNGRLKIKNNTDLKLEYVKTYFVDSEGPLQDPFIFENVESDAKLVKPLEKMYLYDKGANLEIRFKFENYEDEYLVDSGYFNDNFDGNVNITFTKVEDGLVKLKVKASNGLLASNRIRCNEVTDVYYKEGKISE